MERIEKNIYHALAQTNGAGAYTVKINKQGVKVNRSFYYTNPAEKKIALLQAQAYRNEEGKAILLTGESATKTSLLTLQAVADEYLKKKTIEKKGAYIEEMRMKALQRDFPKLFNTPIQQLKRADFEKWIDDSKSKKKNATINKEIHLFSSFFKFAKQKDGQEWVTNLVEGMTLKVEEEERRNFTHDIFNDIIEATDSETLKVAISLALLAGMRRTEIATLKKSNVLLLNKTPHIKLVETKNGEGRIIPLQPALAEILSMLIEGLGQDEYLFKSRDKQTHIEPHSITTSFVRAKARLIELEKYSAEELEGFKFHNGRGRFATDLVLNGVDILTTAKVGGWKTLSVLKKHYYNPNADELAKRMGLK
jgi:integrase